MVAILCGLPKDDRVASSRLLNSTRQRYRNSRNTLYILQRKVIWKRGFGNWTITTDYGYA